MCARLLWKSMIDRKPVSSPEDITDITKTCSDGPRFVGSDGWLYV